MSAPPEAAAEFFLIARRVHMVEELVRWGCIRAEPIHPLLEQDLRRALLTGCSLPWEAYRSPYEAVIAAPQGGDYRPRPVATPLPPAPLGGRRLSFGC